jgi:multidrug efflux pump
VNLSAPFIRRPIATVLLTIGLAIAGLTAFFVLPVAPLPNVEFPGVMVTAGLAGASPSNMATSVATPLERRLAVISGLNEITSRSTTGQTRINLQFDLSKDVDVAAREVQAAINASSADMPISLRRNPTYRKLNSGAMPVIILALTSNTRTPGQIYDAASNILQQRISAVDGVGDVTLGGSSLPAVRVGINPQALNAFGLTGEDVRAAVQAASANRPKGAVDEGDRRLQIYTVRPGRTAADYRDLVIAWRNGAPVRLKDVADVTDGVQDVRTLGLYNGRPAVVVNVTQQAGANIIRVVDKVLAVLPELQAELPGDIKIEVASDATTSIRASLHEIEVTLLISVALVVLVVSAFLRSARATIIPAAATVVSLLGTFGAMYLFGFSLNNFSLMALTVATGFVVDDAIVVLENTSRHLEAGMGRFEAAILGAREVGFTVLSISVSLVAVFIPLLFMGGLAGRLFREFAVTLSSAVMISLVISLTTTPMMCAWLLRREGPARPRHRLARWAEAGWNRTLRLYEGSLDWALGHKRLTMLILAVVIGLNVYLYTASPKGFFPQQDSRRLNGGMNADQSISAQAMGDKLRQMQRIIGRDPAVKSVVGFTGGGQAGGGFLAVELKPPGERPGVRGQDVAQRLRPQLSRVTGVAIALSPQQDVRMGGLQGTALYQYRLMAENLPELKTWAARLGQALKSEPALTDVDNSVQDNGLESYVDIDRDAAARMGATPRDVSNALYDSFGQRQIATLYQDINQYAVILENHDAAAAGPGDVALVNVPVRSTTAATTPSGVRAPPAASFTPVAGRTPVPASRGAIADLYAPFVGTAPNNASPAAATTASVTPATVANPGLRDSAAGQGVSTTFQRTTPLPAMARFIERAAPATIVHQDGQIAGTISFNLAPGRAISDAERAFADAQATIGMPANVHGAFVGTALLAQQQNAGQPLLIAAALVTVYIVLGILYESLIHPITVLSTLPSAGVGAVYALLLFQMEFSIIALIGVFLLIGIVKKNAILIIDFALEAQRARGLSATEAVREACLMRFRPILMTTLAAGLGALPLAIGFGEGSELRQPLGVAIIGGLIASQLLTLLTTPVVYIYLDRLRPQRRDQRFLSRLAGPETAPAPAE